MKKLLAICLIAASPMVYGEKNWTGEGDIAYNRATGNTDTNALLANLKLIYERDKWRHTGQVEAINSSENDTRSAESYTLRAKSDYQLSDALYTFGAFRYEDNRFSGYEYQSSLAAGLGYKIIDTEATQFNVEGGAGYRRSEEAITGETFNEAVGIAAVRFHHELTDTTRFESDLNVESGADNTFAESVIALKVRINSRLALRVAYTVKHNTDVPDDTKNTDTMTSVGLNFNF